MPQIISPLAAASPVTTQHRAALSAWPIDRRPLIDRKPLQMQMAEALVSIRERNGIATEQDLLRLGFTMREIMQYGMGARIGAVKLRPDLATEAEKRAAGISDRKAVAQ